MILAGHKASIKGVADARSAASWGGGGGLGGF